MKRLMMLCLAIIAPWIVLFIKDNPSGALLALLLQASIIGWLPASMWAWRVVKGTEKAKTS